MADMRTPLGRVRGLGSAKDGTGHFWRVRLTSVALVPLSLFVIGLIVSLTGASQEEVRAVLGRPFVALIVGAFILVSLGHMRLGMQDIIEDYVHAEGARVAVLMFNIFFTVAVGAVCILALVGIVLGV